MECIEHTRDVRVSLGEQRRYDIYTHPGIPITAASFQLNHQSKKGVGVSSQLIIGVLLMFCCDGENPGPNISDLSIISNSMDA